MLEFVFIEGPQFGAEPPPTPPPPIKVSCLPFMNILCTAQDETTRQRFLAFQKALNAASAALGLKDRVPEDGISLGISVKTVLQVVAKTALPQLPKDMPDRDDIEAIAAGKVELKQLSEMIEDATGMYTEIASMVQPASSTERKTAFYVRYRKPILIVGASAVGLGLLGGILYLVRGR